MIQKFLLALIRGYQIVLSPYIGWHCRFEPTCSAYAIQALKSHGTIRGLQLTLHRLWCCRLGGGCGYDPVPKVMKRETRSHET